MTNLEDLVKALSEAELRKFLLTTLALLGFPTASWHLGGVYRTIIALFAKVCAPFTNLQVALAKSGFLDYATEKLLDVVAEQVYGVPREQARFAVGPLTLNNTAGGLFTFNAEEFRVFNPVSKKVYRNKVGFTLNPLQTGLVIEIEAVEVGSASSSEADTITELETVANGVEVTNAIAIFGVDKETDGSLRERCRLKLGSFSPNGPADAYAYVARTPSINGGVVVNRTNPVPDSDTGESTLYVAGPSGAILPSDVAKIQDACDVTCTPLGFDCTIASATNLVIDVEATVWFPSSLNLTPADVKTAIEAHMTAWLAGLPIGGYFITLGGRIYEDAIEGELRNAKIGDTPITLITTSLLEPAGNVVVADNEVPVPGTVTITAIQVTT
ncbi:MAG: hypothetical protein HOW73_34635 [Polyangiaceae bacterium]|nr:hypothetical protein [Polyangiaceae bacterium]